MSAFGSVADLTASNELVRLVPKPDNLDQLNYRSRPPVVPPERAPPNRRDHPQADAAQSWNCFHSTGCGASVRR